MTQMAPETLAEDFLKTAPQFRLGFLPTEQFHPQTTKLSSWSNDNIPKALEVWKSIDLSAFEQVLEKKDPLAQLEKTIHSTLGAGKRVYIYGCGATGRLALTLEHCWRHENPAHGNGVVGFMSGGDLALVHSIENFEDHPDFGARQVREIGFSQGDLMIAVTEGGETPSVIGALLEARNISSLLHAFLFCNPPELLKENLERSRSVLECQDILNISFPIGPMALAGSTRLQATSVLLLAVGCALFKLDPNLLIKRVADSDWKFLEPFIVEESAAYKRGDYLLYEAEEFAISVLTDTTERAPTFSLAGFENRNESSKQTSWSFLAVPSCAQSPEAWRKILLREPKSLEWSELNGVGCAQRLVGFDFSRSANEFRSKRIAPSKQSVFSVSNSQQSINFQLDHLQHSLPVQELPYFYRHLFLKLLLNVHSTLVMGRMGRFEGNIMTWVRPSNRKLIDRSARYIEYLLQQRGHQPPSYHQIVHEIFKQMPQLSAQEPIVPKVVGVFLETTNRE